jgi:hypothetical protein
VAAAPNPSAPGNAGMAQVHVEPRQNNRNAANRGLIPSPRIVAIFLMKSFGGDPTTPNNLTFIIANTELKKKMLVLQIEKFAQY